MRSDTLITALMAVGALAQPLQELEKRAIEYVTEYEIVYETVYVEPSQAAATPTPSPIPTTITTSTATAASTPPAYPANAGSALAAAGDPSSYSHHHSHAHSTTSTPSILSSPSPTSEAFSSSPAVVAEVSTVAAADPAPAPSSTPEASDTPPASTNTLQGTCVDSHNAIRAKHNAGALTWDDDLAQSAQALAAGCVFEHNVDLGPASGYGQNIAESWGTLELHDELAEASAVIGTSWYTAEEAKFAALGLYGVANPLGTDFDAWGHFTQEVWKSTTKVGCAVQKCTTGYFTVCNYDPPGNYAGEFAENVSQ